MDLENPMPFSEAVKHLLAKKVMPTDLSSADLRDIDSSIRRQSLFSARTTNEDYLTHLQGVLESILNPSIEQRPDRVSESNPQGNVTTGFNPATARSSLRQFLVDSGYAPNEDERGTIKDLSSDKRIDFVIKTNTMLAQGAGHFIQGNESQDAVDSMPALELLRFEDRMVPRGEKMVKGEIEADPENAWPERFRAAAEESGDDDALRVLEETGRMIALKASPLWESLGSGAGGYEDTLGNPYPPFAFNSGMWTQGVTYDECVEVGLIDDGDPVHANPLDLTSLFKTPTQEAA